MVRPVTFLVACLSLFLVAGSPGATEPAAGKPKLNANQFVTFGPFVVPLVDAAEPDQQYLLRMALELRDEDDREIVLGLIPRLRQEIYNTLFRTVSFRTRTPRIPPQSLLKRDILEVTRSITGPKMVTRVVFLQATTTRSPR